jgi:hypothetical protein
MRRRRFFVSVVALLVSIGLPAAALADPYKVVFVTDNTANESAYVTFLQSIYGNDLVIDLTANKYTDTLSASLKAELAAANLIIVSRQTNSANYDFEPQFWNNLDVPMILHNAFLARGGASQPRWRWLNGNGDDESGITTVDVHAPADPIYFGVNVVGGQVAIYSGNQNVSLTTATSAGNGTLVASQVGGIDGAFIARWDGTESAYFTGSTQAPGAPRIFFSFPSTGASANDAVFFNVATTDGRLMLENALTSLLPVPEPGALLLPVAGSFLLLRRRRSA